MLDVRIRRIFSQWQKHIYQKTFIWRNTFSLLRLKKKISYSCVFDFLSFIQVFMAYDHVGLYNTICLFHIFLVVHYWGFMLIKLAVYHDLWFKWPTWTKFNGFLLLTFYYRLLRRNIYSSPFITEITKRTQRSLIMEIQRYIRTYSVMYKLWYPSFYSYKTQLRLQCEQIQNHHYKQIWYIIA